MDKQIDRLKHRLIRGQKDMDLQKIRQKNGSQADKENLPGSTDGRIGGREGREV